ncbi:UNVERIFIED_CONTAM: DNA mismatch repair protein MLH3 [Sesamum latifolium]|uniref:DNA mismatch repair protein MLH3 n=1 Tax=Sesamum latifolium TaxID=2727402 RepID=A0AAW2Y9A5_9LAMI
MVESRGGRRPAMATTVSWSYIQMRNIKRLPEAIHSSVRSGVVIADLTRIVEELVFNSLDAGATKVSIAVGVGSSYVKVVDNGSGITRDGLVLLGERHGLDLKEIQDFDSGWKWQKCSLTAAGGTVPDYSKNQDTVLDISSDILHLGGDPLVPKSIDRTSLEDAKVLNQVDKKFIAVVAGKTLAIIDQHAADERIRLEELRHKVLSGEMKTVTYLDAEQELVLPEIGHQLLHNYAEEIQTWGWICNIHSHDGSSFVKHLDFLNRQPAIVKLLAVPCILGVNLTDIDLLEFLQQLADTDGSSTIPPCVHRVLNNKACRGAIMFGDTLLPSECSLIVEELKRTSLCFQCAHGRPTTVPLVSLDLLHNKIVKLGSHESWHGLCQHELSLNRSAQRLRSALC